MQNCTRNILMTVPYGLMPWSVQAPLLANRTLVLLPLLLLFVVVSITGCGSGGDGDTGSGETSPSNPESQPALQGATLSGVSPVILASIDSYASKLATAQTDLSRAYEEARGRTPTTVLAAADIGGQSLSPGLYKSVDSLDIVSADLVLDAHGDERAVWIFQIGDALRVATGRQIILSGGAKASNVYWQVARSAVLGEYAVFKGTILAQDSIALRTGASLEGRALTRTGEVSLSANTITQPLP